MHMPTLTPPAEPPGNDAEERTAHQIRRLLASIRDLQNALRRRQGLAGAQRPPRHALAPDALAAADPYSRIRANNERGVFPMPIESIQDIGIMVVGLDGLGALVAQSLCRYGVQHLIVADGAEIARGDLDYMTYYPKDLGRQRDHHLAAACRELNPDVDAFAIGLPLSNVKSLVRVLTMIITDEDEGDEDDDDEHPREDEVDPEGLVGGDGSRLGGKQEDDGGAMAPQHDFRVVFLCGMLPELAVALNEFCCEFGLQFVYVSIGKNGITGDVFSVLPGRSSCLQCLDKRKILKLPTSTESHVEPKTTYPPCLPPIECILAGLAVQLAFSNILSAGEFSSRVEYDGLREELDRSGLVAPVHQCASAFCREQQQRHAAATLTSKQ